MEATNEPISLPLPTIRRYPLYLRAIRRKIANGETDISSAVLAEELGLDPVLMRKDLAMSGAVGRPRRGYPARELLEALNRALGWDNVTEAALIGAGSLGHALLGFKGFAEHNLRIVVAFDANPELQGTTVHGVQIHSPDELKKLIKRLALKIGILCVPNAAAQECADLLVEAGVKGIWNFTTVQLNLPPEVKMAQVDLAESLAVLSHAITGA